MSSQQVDVEVFNADRQVDGPLRRPVRLLPTGDAGVVYGGEVYPLYRGNRIDITAPCYDKYDCASFVADGELIPFAATPTPSTRGVRPAPVPLPEGDWNLETNRFGHYVVFNADESTAEHVVDRLDAGPLGVRRWDASHRPASDGRHYDWFVRLAFKGERDECLRQVRSHLSHSGTPPAQPLELDGVPSNLRTAVLSALQKALAVARENSTLKQERDRLKADLAQVRAETNKIRMGDCCTDR
ncbi:hypothetical protein [Nocardioides pacificus]